LSSPETSTTMPVADVCRGCSITQAARNLQGASGAWFIISRGQGNTESENAKDSRPTSTWRTAASKRVEVHKILGPARTRTSIVTLPHPKITEGPSLVKRKVGSSHWDVIHEGIQGQKRDSTVCPSDFRSCPQSVNGGCCPNDRICGTASCLPTSTAPASACGVSGYFPCDIAVGGVCILHSRSSQG